MYKLLIIFMSRSSY